jgi:beta-glucanase (GH16 family)
MRTGQLPPVRTTAVVVCALTTLACAGLPAPLSLDDLSAPSLAELGITGRWTLVWSDEFSATSIDPQRWTHLVRPGVNGERQYYVDHPENSFVAGGALHIVAREETFGGGNATRPYTSAQLVTRLKGDWTYGRFEVRAKVPEGQGLWPTIWLMPTESSYGEWAASGEVDIAEFRGQEPSTVHGTLHYGGRGLATRTPGTRSSYRMAERSQKSFTSSR